VVSNNATLSKGFKGESNSEPMSIYEGTIGIENHTTYVLHVTIHGENETRSAVGPKQGDECAKTYLTIQDDFVHVTIQNKIRLGYDLSRMLCLSYLKIYMIPFSPLELWFSKP
jgi:hypothetical protein